MDGALLAVAPDAGHGLQVVGRVPVDVVHHQTRGADQVQAHSARFGTQQEDPCTIQRLRYWNRLSFSLHHERERQILRKIGEMLRFFLSFRKIRNTWLLW